MENVPFIEENEQNLEREARIALTKIRSIDRLIKNTIEEQLQVLKKGLEKIFQDDPVFSIGKPDDKKFDKKRNKLKFAPDILWFNLYGIDFYIAFTIKTIKNETITNLVGCLIYGTCYFIEKDKVEDKPLLSFNIDNHNIISSKNDFEDDSWTFDTEDLLDLHLRSIDKIWEEALYFINKDNF